MACWIRWMLVRLSVKIVWASGGGLLCGGGVGFRVSWIWSNEQYKAVSSALKMVLVSD